MAAAHGRRREEVDVYAVFFRCAGVANQAELDPAGRVVIDGLAADAGLPAEMLANVPVERRRVAIGVLLHAAAIAAEARVIAPESHAEQANNVGRETVVNA